MVENAAPIHAKMECCSLQAFTISFPYQKSSQVGNVYVPTYNIGISDKKNKVTMAFIVTVSVEHLLIMPSLCFPKEPSVVSCNNSEVHSEASFNKTPAAVSGYSYVFSFCFFNRFFSTFCFTLKLPENKKLLTKEI